MEFDRRPIGVMDSGVGGLSIYREIIKLLPGEDILYFADQGHVPYGPRPRDEIRKFAAGITRFFIENEAKLVVVACNAASAASLAYLRNCFPDLGFVGMEPAIKPASEKTRSGVIGVLTTKATFQGELFSSLMDRYAKGLDVIVQISPEFVTLVEEGQLDTEESRRVAEKYLSPMIEAGADQIVLGCTHFPFLTPLFKQLLPDSVDVIDPSGAVALQAFRRNRGMQNDPNRNGKTVFFTSGDVEKLRRLERRLLGETSRAASFEAVRWQGDQVIF